MTNAWLEHVKATQEKNKGISYKEAMVKAKETYKSSSSGGSKKAPPTPPPTPAKKSVGRPRKQAGTGAFVGEAQAAAQAIGVAGDVSKGVISAVQNDKSHNGRYDKAVFNKRTKEFGRLKKLMSKQKWPQQSDAELLKYIESKY